MSLAIAVESVVACWDELLPLAAKHYAAVQGWDAPFRMDCDHYAAMDRAGAYLFATARDEAGRLSGYVGMIFGPHHFADTIIAIQDCIWLEPQHRQGWNAQALIGAMDAALRDRGASIVLHSIKIDHDWSPILRTLGYRPAEMLWERRLHPHKDHKHG